MKNIKVEYENDWFQKNVLQQEFGCQLIWKVCVHQTLLMRVLKLKKMQKNLKQNLCKIQRVAQGSRAFA